MGKKWKRMLVARRAAAKAAVGVIQEERHDAKPEKAVVPAADEAVEKKAPKVKKAPLKSAKSKKVSKPKKK